MKLIYTLLFSTLIGAVNLNAQRFKSAIELNNYVVSVNDTLYGYGKEWGTAFQTAHSSSNYEALTPIRMKMENFVHKKMKEFRSMADYKGSKALTNAAAEFFKYEAKLILRGFVPFELFDDRTTQAEKTAALKMLTELTREEETKMVDLQAAQEAYGRRNGFSIEPAN